MNDTEAAPAPLTAESAILLTSGRPVLELEPILQLHTAMKAPTWGISLDWPKKALGGVDRLELVVDFANPQPRLVLVSYLAQSIIRVQRIRLYKAAARKSRWRLVCPVTGNAHERLFWREGRFASAKAQRLVHPSQRRGKAVSSE